MVEVIEKEPFVCLSVFVFVSVCVSVCWRSHSQTVRHMVTKFDTGVDIDNISDEFAGQGHRSMAKVTMSKKHHFQDFLI